MSNLLDEADESLAALERSGRRRSRITAALILVAVIAFLGVGAVLVADVVYPGLGQYARGLVAGENDIFGEPTYSPEHDVSAEVLAEKVDLDEVHGDLLPTWLAALSYDEAGLPSKRSVARFEALAQAVEGDPNLHDIVVSRGARLAPKRTSGPSTRRSGLAQHDPGSFDATLRFRAARPDVLRRDAPVSRSTTRRPWARRASRARGGRWAQHRMNWASSGALWANSLAHARHRLGLVARGNRVEVGHQFCVVDQVGAIALQRPA